MMKLKKLNEIKEIEKTVDRENVFHRASEYTYSFKNFQTIKNFLGKTFIMVKLL